MRSFWALKDRKVLGSEGNAHVLVAHVFLHDDSLSAMANAKLPVFTPSPYFFDLLPSLLANSPSTLSLVLYWSCFFPLFLYNTNSALLLFCKLILQAHPCSRFPQTTLAFLIYGEKCCRNQLLPNTLLSSSFQMGTAGGLEREKGRRGMLPAGFGGNGTGCAELWGAARTAGREWGGMFQGSWIWHRRHFSPPLGKGTQLIAETRSGSPLL